MAEWARCPLQGCPARAVTVACLPTPTRNLTARYPLISSYRFQVVLSRVTVPRLVTTNPRRTRRWKVEGAAPPALAPPGRGSSLAPAARDCPGVCGEPRRRGRACRLEEVTSREVEESGLRASWEMLLGREGWCLLHRMLVSPAIPHVGRCGLLIPIF